jgi:uncharacterized protein (DUF433 family)
MARAAAPTLSPREVAELAGTPKRAVEKAIEERVLAVRSRAVPRGARMAGRLLPSYAVAYTALVANLDLKLGIDQKKRLLTKLARLAPAEVSSARIELAPAVEVDVGRLIGDAMERAERYRSARDKFIVIDDAVKGGTPVIRGTRMTVYSVLGRIEHGEAIEDLLDDNPDLPHEAIEAALTYARTHPLRGRPGGRPWVAAA